MDLLARPRVVIIGGGFGGLYAARDLKDAQARVTVIDRRNYHLFQPLLYQVAMGALSPADIASPLREVLKRQPNVEVLLGEAVDVDVAGKRVILSDGEVPFDVLILAAGAENHYFGNDAWAAHAPALKTVEDATRVRRRVLLAFEAAEREADPAARQALLTFVVIGGGPTGVELAGAIAELARDMRKDFRSIDTVRSRILLVEASGRILETFPPELAARAVASLERLGVTVLTGRKVTGVDAEGIRTSAGGVEDRIASRTVLWAAGVRATPLGRVLAAKTGAALDRGGRVVVAPDLSVPGHPDLFVIGDLASFPHQGDRPLPGVAPVAMQEGMYVARLLKARWQGETEPPFRYRDRGNLATIGRSAAVADLGRYRFGGFFAWILWLFIHLIYLIGFDNKLLVLFQWAWNYFTWNRSARLITGPSPLPLKGGAEGAVDHREAC